MNVFPLAVNTKAEELERLQTVENPYDMCKISTNQSD